MVVGCAQREFLAPLVEEAGIGDVFEPLYVANSYFGGNVDVTGLLVGADIVGAVLQRAAEGRVPKGDALSGAAEPASICADAVLPLESRSQGTDAYVFLVPRVVFNDDGLTLDDMTLEDMQEAAGLPIHMVSCTPLEYFAEITRLLKDSW